MTKGTHGRRWVSWDDWLHAGDGSEPDHEWKQARMAARAIRLGSQAHWHAWCVL
jgi:hypothetical protein